MTHESLLPTRLQRLANGKTVRVARLGSGLPFILLHGYPENLQVWHQLAPLLAESFQVIALDWPGMGESEAWSGGTTPQLMARRLKLILDEWQIRKAVIAGADMGGQPALAFASEFPERVAGVVVMNSLVFGDEKTSWEIRLLRRFGFNRFVLRRFPGLIFSRAESTFLPRGFKVPEAVRSDFWRTFRKPEVRTFISRMCAGYQGTLHLLPELYRKISAPTLVLWAEHDKHFPPVQATRLNDTIPHSELTVISGGTHWMMLDRAEELRDAIAGWQKRSKLPAE